MQKLYAYQEMSNKVQQADRRGLRPRDGEPTGEVESLRGRNVGRMGDRVARPSEGIGVTEKNRPAELAEKMDRAAKKRERREAQLQGGGGGTGVGGKRRRAGESVLGSGGRTILDMGDLNGYQPSNPGSQSSYESLLVSSQFATERRFVRPTSYFEI